MRRLWTKFNGLAIICLYVFPTHMLAAGGGGGEAIVFVADSRRHTGVLAWFSNLYNDSLALFTLFTVITIPLLALTLSLVLGSLLAKTGIDLKSKSVGGH